MNQDAQEIGSKGSDCQGKGLIEATIKIDPSEAGKRTPAAEATEVSIGIRVSNRFFFRGSLKPFVLFHRGHRNISVHILF